MRHIKDIFIGLMVIVFMLTPGIITAVVAGGSATTQLVPVHDTKGIIVGYRQVPVSAPVNPVVVPDADKLNARHKAMNEEFLKKIRERQEVK